jgi:hypothetical protein
MGSLYRQGKGRQRAGDRALAHSPDYCGGFAVGLSAAWPSTAIAAMGAAPVLFAGVITTRQ